jgi:ATP synthase protein I
VWQVFRPVIGLQILCTAAISLLSAWLAGLHGAISAAFGGSIGIIASLVFAALAARSRPTKSAGEALYAALRAEAVKVVLMIVLLWAVLATYKNVVAAGLIGAFIATVLVSTLAVWVRTKQG